MDEQNNMDETQPIGGLSAAPTGLASGTAVAPARRTPRLRWLAAGTAAAVFMGVGGAGIGYAVGRAQHDGALTPASTQDPSNGPSGGSQGQTQMPYGSGGNGYGSQGSNPFGQSGGGYGSFGGSGGNFGGNSGGYGEYRGGSSSSSGAGTKAATSSQLTGLVRISTDLGYEGGAAAGTGLILTSSGEVITNHHVVAGATSITAKDMSTGKTYTAKVIGTDSVDDVAVLQLQNAAGLATVATDTDNATVGEQVTAVGDAEGTATLSAAAGKVVALNQSITTQSEEGAASEHLTGMIEINSDVISGDSGGATYNAQGEVVGMTTAASTGTGDVTGYAIPISRVLSVAGAIETHTPGTRYHYGYPAFLGIGLGQTGTQVEEVFNNTPASKAGIVAGDSITAVNGTKVSTSSALRKAIAGYLPGTSVSITWSDANGTSHTAKVTLITGPVQ